MTQLKIKNRLNVNQTSILLGLLHSWNLDAEIIDEEKAENKRFSYEEIVARATEQDSLVVAGIMKKPQRIIRSFTSKERQAFDTGISLNDYIKSKPNVPV